ncbi:MAG: energy transducer TonB [Bacteroidetes bacterium]|nr:energy transducer TonB [Bacteroidota bacterium]
MNLKKARLTRSFVIGSFVLFGLAACHSNDYKSYNDKASGETMSSDTSASTAIIHSDTAATNASSSQSATVARKKGRWSIKMPDKSSTVRIEKDREGVYTRAEAMPEFPGGQTALDNYVNNNIEYPQQAIDNNTSGTIKVSFVVDEQGKVQDAHVIGAPLGNGLDEQALRVVSNMPTWKPGKVKGKNVKTRLELPIAFQVEA